MVFGDKSSQLFDIYAKDCFKKSFMCLTLGFRSNRCGDYQERDQIVKSKEGLQPQVGNAKSQYRIKHKSMQK